MGRSLTTTVSEYLAAAAGTPLPPGAEEAARHHLVDSLAAVVSGSVLLPGRHGLLAAAGVEGRPESTLVAGRRLSGAAAAALANGMAAHADETDDSHAPSLSHPGCAVVPAGLAAGEREAVSGQVLLRAVAAGYDVGCRVGLALGRDAVDMRRSAPSSHSVVATFAAAAAAAVVNGLDAGGCAYALSYAAQQAAGVTTWQRDGDHVEKAFVFGGRPALAGVMSADFARAGATGVAEVFDGHPNVLAALSGSPDGSRLTDGLGTDFEIARTNIKRYCVGSPAQAAVQAAEEIMAGGTLRPEEVSGIEITLPADLAGVVDGRAMPDVNVQYLVAVTLLDGTLSFAAAHDQPRMEDGAVRRLMGLTALAASPERAGTRSARVSISTTGGGEPVVAEVDHVRGTAENPMAWDEVAAKAGELMGPVLGSVAAAELIDTVAAMAEKGDARSLGRILRSGPA